jgi:hypothetical protein
MGRERHRGLGQRLGDRNGRVETDHRRRKWAARSLHPGLEAKEVGELREAHWEQSLRECLARKGRSEENLATKPMRQAWKNDIADEVRRASGASIAWLARRLHLGTPNSGRSYLWTWKKTRGAKSGKAGTRRRGVAEAEKRRPCLG